MSELNYNQNQLVVSLRVRYGSYSENSSNYTTMWRVCQDHPPTTARPGTQVNLSPQKPSDLFVKSWLINCVLWATCNCKTYE